MANVSLWQLGSYSKNTELIFNNKAGRNSAIADKGVATKVATVDTILCGMAAGYIKADVEGADMETLIGMQKTMENYKPKLNFSAYHRFEDIFRLALYIRDGVVVYEGDLESLKRFKDDVKEVAAGYECGLVFKKFNDVKEGDWIEAYTMVEVPR